MTHKWSITPDTRAFPNVRSQSSGYIYWFNNNDIFFFIITKVKKLNNSGSISLCKAIINQGFDQFSNGWYYYSSKKDTQSLTYSQLKIECFIKVNYIL